MRKSKPTHDPIWKIVKEANKYGKDAVVTVVSGTRKITVDIFIYQQGEQVSYRATGETLSKAADIAITMVAGKMDQLPPKEWENI